MIKLEDGKYKFYYEDHMVKCDRYGEKWRDFLGNKAITALFHHTIELQFKLDSVSEILFNDELSIQEAGAKIMSVIGALDE